MNTLAGNNELDRVIFLMPVIKLKNGLFPNYFLNANA